MKPWQNFLNVDLEIKSRFTLEALVRELGDQVSVLYSETNPHKHFVALESSKILVRNPDRLVHHLCSALEKLSPAAQKAWDRAHCKVFDFGFEAVWEVCNYQNYPVSAASLKRISALGGSVAISCYNRKGDELGGSATSIQAK